MGEGKKMHVELFGSFDTFQLIPCSGALTWTGRMLALQCFLRLKSVGSSRQVEQVCLGGHWDKSAEVNMRCRDHDRSNRCKLKNRLLRTRIRHCRSPEMHWDSTIRAIAIRRYLANQTEKSNLPYGSHGEIRGNVGGGGVQSAWILRTLLDDLIFREKFEETAFTRATFGFPPKLTFRHLSFPGSLA